MNAGLRIVASAVACCALALALAGPASAITRAQAETIALEALKPESVAGEVVVFGLPKALKASASVHEFSTGTRLKGPGRKAWLFWEDLEPGADFQHPSRALVVDDRTGRIVANRALAYFPLVDGKPAVFIRTDTAYFGSQYAVFSSLDDAAPTPAPARAATAPRLPAGIPQPALDGECVLLVVHTPPTDRQRQYATNALNDWVDLADSLGVPSYVATSAGPAPTNLPGPLQPPPFNGQVANQSLARVIRTLINRERCTDIVIYILGHGVAPPGWKDDSGQVAKGGRPFIETATEELTKQELDAGAEPRLKGISLNSLEVIVQDNLGRASFKFVIDSCHSGRFKDELADEPNVKIVTTAATADEVAYGNLNLRTDLPEAAVRNPGRTEFTHGMLEGMRATLANSAEVDALAGLGDSLMARLIKAGFDKENVNDRAARGGLTHPLEMNNLPPPPYAFGAISHQHREGQTTIICGGISGPPGATVQVRLRHVPTGNTATGPPRTFGPGGLLGWGFTLSENGGFSVEVLVDGVPLATARYEVPAPPTQGPFPCAPSAG
jgi:hypothetical protein